MAGECVNFIATGLTVIFTLWRVSRMISGMNTLAKNLRRMRIERRLSQRGLADVVGVSYPRISEIERGVSNPTLATLELIAQALNVSVSTLLESPRNKKLANHG